MRGVALFLAALVLLLPVPASPFGSNAVHPIREAEFLVSADRSPPPAQALWRHTALPRLNTPVPRVADGVVWFRMHIDLPARPSSFWGLLLPYLYGGGQVWLDGVQVADNQATTAGVIVRWERPHLVAIPDRMLHEGRNEVWVRVNAVVGERSIKFPQPLVGPVAALQPHHDRRLFWVHTVPRLTVAACLAVAAFVLLIWWRLPEEVLYGWFGLATVLWGIRTLTFVLETVPASHWPLWRLVYMGATGGFVVVMLIFAFCLAGLRSRWVERALLVYWLSGPAWFALHGIASDDMVNRVWTAGLIPIAIANVVVAFLTVWRQRTPAALLLPVALAFATLCGIHDYLIAWRPGWLGQFAPAWVGERFFMLHHGANVLLLTMGLLVTMRFIRTVRALQDLNQTLETRIADRERTLSENYARLAYLERQNAAAEERKLITREIHDGLGSKLFTSLSRVERGAMDSDQMAASLGACIADMRLALDALAPDEPDLLVTFGDFMFRWQGELDAVGVRCTWRIEAQADALLLPPHATLQLLRVAQEALTNVAKHSNAAGVELALQHRDGTLTLVIADDGVGTGGARSSAGRGMHNMRARAAQLGGTLVVDHPDGRGTRVVLAVPCPMIPPSA